MKTPSVKSPFADLRRRLPGLMPRDRHRLRRRIDGAEKIRDPDRRRAVAAEISADIDTCEARVERRRSAFPAIDYPAELPVSQKKDEILAAIRDHQVVIVAGETGSGKTTQLPKICLELGRGVLGQIGHTQPRRLAARTVAARIAEELGTTLGEWVGYKVRFTDVSSDDTLVKAAVALHADELARENRDKELAGKLQQAYAATMQAEIDFKASRGQPVYPDANSTLRVAFGQVKGRAPGVDGTTWTAFTTLRGIVAKHTANGEFNAPAEQLAAIKAKRFDKYGVKALDSVPVNFLATLDTTGGPTLTIGGPAGSPAFNPDVAARVVGTGEAARIDFNPQGPLALPAAIRAELTRVLGLSGWTPEAARVRLSGADLNGDGAIDLADLAILMGNHGKSGALPGDLNQDQKVDDADVRLFSGQYRP